MKKKTVIFIEADGVLYPDFLSAEDINKKDHDALRMLQLYYEYEGKGIFFGIVYDISQGRFDPNKIPCMMSHHKVRVAGGKGGVHKIEQICQWLEKNRYTPEETNVYVIWNSADIVNYDNLYKYKEEEFPTFSNWRHTIRLCKTANATQRNFDHIFSAVLKLKCDGGNGAIDEVIYKYIL